VLDNAEKAAQREGVKVDTVLLESIGGVAADLILAQAKQWPADLIVMGTHGRRGLARLAMGSDAEQVVRAALVPVMLVRGVAQQGKVTPEVRLMEASAACWRCLVDLVGFACRQPYRGLGRRAADRAGSRETQKRGYCLPIGGRAHIYRGGTAVARSRRCCRRYWGPRLPRPWSLSAD